MVPPGRRKPERKALMTTTYEIRPVACGCGYTIEIRDRHGVGPASGAPMSLRAVQAWVRAARRYGFRRLAPRGWGSTGKGGAR